MSDDKAELSGPDLTRGVELSTIADGAMLLGHARGEPVLLARRGDEIFAIGAVCTHYGAPLDQGLLVGDTVRCPWHHACFSLRTGEALRAPALDPVSVWEVEVARDSAGQGLSALTPAGLVFVRKRLESNGGPSAAPTPAPASIVIVGGGAAGNAAAETLRREGYTGRITMFSADPSPPCDRPKLSKDFLSGEATEEAIPLRPTGFYEEHGIDLRLGARVAKIDSEARRVELADGGRYAYDALLLATGAEPVRLDVPGAALGHVHSLRTVDDARALLASALVAKRAIVVGASFIGLEVAASLRNRGIEVNVVGTDTVVMEKVLGPEVGNFLRKLHEDHGVSFHLGTRATLIDERGMTLENGDYLEADLIVVGIGVKPAISLAEQAGIGIDGGVIVDEYLQTNLRGVFAAGDIALWPDRLTGERVRVEHWVVAERQGQTAARNMLGRRDAFRDVPFFWTIQYDFGLGYVGHAAHWDEVDIEGSLEARDCAVTYRLGGRKLAMAVVQRDMEGLRAEVEFEQAMAGSGAGADPRDHP